MIGVGRSDWTDASLREAAEKSIRAAQGETGSIDDVRLSALLERLSYVRGDYSSPLLYDSLAQSLSTHRTVLAYLAVPPTVFTDVVCGLMKTDLKRSARLLIEKPFGTNLDTAQQLARDIADEITEDRVFPIDHFLQKESLQNLLVLRFANRIFEPTWSRDHIESISVTVAEDFGIGGRAGFFDTNGTMRDVVQNHVLQIVAALAMEPPASSSADAMNDARHEVLDAVVPLTPPDVVLGQYEGYLDTEGVDPNSTTNTYVQATLHIENDRWQGVRWTVTAGKAMDRTVTEAVITFLPAPELFFIDECEPAPNRIVLQLSPTESMELSLQARSGARSTGTAAAAMVSDESYRSSEALSAYARMFDDARRGDHSQFVRRDVVEASWRIVDGVLDPAERPMPYAQGTAGPGNYRSVNERGESGRKLV